MQYEKFFIRIQRMRISCCVKIRLSQSFLIFQYHSRIKVIKIVGKAYKSTTSSSASSNSSFGIPKLPIDYVRAELVSKIREHDILIVMGETGSGKTTQLPQYIQDARLINGQIGVTQVCFIFVLYFTNETVKLGVKVDLLYQGLMLTLFTLRLKRGQMPKNICNGIISANGLLFFIHF